MPEHSLVQSHELRQEQILAPQQIQSLEILLLPLLELQEKISQELEENPVLELEKKPGEDLAGDVLSATSASTGEGGDDQAVDKKDDQELAELFQLSDSWHDYLPPAPARQTFSSDDEEKRQHFFNSLTDEPTLQEQLMGQLRLSDYPERERLIAELIIGSIDDYGYLRSHLADLASACNADMSEMERVLEVIQNFEPPGIGARDLRECLLLQLRRKDERDPKIIKLVENHLADLARNRLPWIARKMKIELDELTVMIEKIKRLNPYPGGSLVPNNPIYVIPEVAIEEKEGQFIVGSNDENLPRLRISRLYRNLLENPDTPAETREYIKTKLNNGKLLMKSIQQRQATIKRIAEVISDTQYDFLREGLEHLRPLTMQQVADKLDLHETTISRAIANKYVQTPVGLFEFKFFFSSGFQSNDGEEISSRGVKEKIRELIMREDPKKPLSDKKIVEFLKEQGLPIARRTVAKYREEIGVPASHLRKKF